MHKNIDYESLLSFVQDNPNAGISLTISENEFDQAIKAIISALITNETPPTQLVSYLEYRARYIYIELSQLSTVMVNNIDIDNGLIWCNEVYIETKAIDLSVLERRSSRFKLFANTVTQIILHPYRTKSKSLILHLDTDAKVIHNKDTNTIIISNLSDIERMM